MANIRTQQFQTNYFSGAQARIFFDDIFVDELQSIQFDAITNRSPIYGYGSTHFDAVAEGNFLINGAFAINYVHDQYLIAVLNKMINQPKNAGSQNVHYAHHTLEVRAKDIPIRQLMNLPTEDIQKLRRGEIARKQEGGLGANYTTFYHAKPFDIRLYIGETERVLQGVILTSSAQMIGASGEPIMETYRFLASNFQ